MKPSTNFLKFYSQLSPVKQRLIDRHSDLIERSKGDIVCLQGAPADAIYAIEEGAVEVVLQAEPDAMPRCVAYLSSGDLFGEMGAITGRPRISTIRACEAVRLRRFSPEKFQKLMETFPAFGVFLVTNLAERLYRLAANHYYMNYSVDFSGNLENFDLLVVFQTLNSSGRTGELILTSASNDLLGGFLFVNGDVVAARFRHLRGLEAMWQVFTEEKFDGSFAFRAMEITPQPEPEEQIILRGMDLLMQAASKRDVYQMLATSSKDLTRTLSPKVDTLNWDDAETADAAQRIWTHIQKHPQPLDTIWRLSNLSSATIVEVTRRMREKGLATLSHAGKE